MKIHTLKIWVVALCLAKGGSILAEEESSESDKVGTSLIETEKTMAVFKREIAEPRFDPFANWVFYRLHFWDLMQAIKEHPHPEKVYEQQARFLALAPVVFAIPFDALRPDGSEYWRDHPAGRRHYRRNCLHHIQALGGRTDLEAMDADAAREIAKADWPIIKQWIETRGEPLPLKEAPSWAAQETHSQAVADRLFAELEKALVGHPHPEAVYEQQANFILFLTRAHKNKGGKTYYDGCIRKIKEANSVRSQRFWESRLWNEDGWGWGAEELKEATSAWFAIHWRHASMDEKKQAVMDGLYSVNEWHRYTRDKETHDKQPIPYKYFVAKDADGRETELKPDPAVVFAYAAKLGRAIRKDFYEMWTDEEEYPVEPHYTEILKLLRQPGMAPTPAEMDRMLNNLAEDGSFRWSPGKSILALYLTHTDDDKRFIRLVDEESWLWSNKDYVTHVRKVFARATPEQQAKMKEAIWAECRPSSREFAYFYSEGKLAIGTLRAKQLFDPEYAFFEKLASVQILGMPELTQACLAELKRFKVDLEKAKSDTSWLPAPKEIEWMAKDRRPSHANLDRFIQEKLDPTIKALESGQIPAATP